MKYISTRDHSAHPQRVTAAEAIKKGLCDDGGLFVPDEIPKLTHGDVERLIGMTYPQRAAYVLSLYLPDYDPTTLPRCIPSRTISIPWSCGMARPARSRIWHSSLCRACSPPH